MGKLTMRPAHLTDGVLAEGLREALPQAGSRSQLHVLLRHRPARRWRSSTTKPTKLSGQMWRTLSLLDSLSTAPAEPCQNCVCVTGAAMSTQGCGAHGA